MCTLFFRNGRDARDWAGGGRNGLEVGAPLFLLYPVPLSLPPFSLSLSLPLPPPPLPIETYHLNAQ